MQYKKSVYIYYTMLDNKTILTPTKAVQARIDKEAKRVAKQDTVKAAQLAKSLINKGINSEMNEALRGLNASASYMSSQEGINTIAKKVERFEGKVSKGSLLDAFKRLDAIKADKASENGKEAKGLILVLNSGERRNQFTNSQLLKAAQFITANKVIDSLG
jgi:hypothetical protein